MDAQQFHNVHPIALRHTCIDIDQVLYFHKYRRAYKAHEYRNNLNLKMEKYKYVNVFAYGVAVLVFVFQYLGFDWEKWEQSLAQTPLFHLLFHPSAKSSEASSSCLDHVASD